MSDYTETLESKLYEILPDEDDVSALRFDALIYGMELALLAGLPQAPSVYNPYNNIELAKKNFSLIRRKSVELIRILEDLDENN